MENVDLARENNEFGKKRETILDHRHTGMYELALLHWGAPLHTAALP